MLFKEVSSEFTRDKLLIFFVAEPVSFEWGNRFRIPKEEKELLHQEPDPKTTRSDRLRNIGFRL